MRISWWIRAAVRNDRFVLPFDAIAGAV